VIAYAANHLERSTRCTLVFMATGGRLQRRLEKSASARLGRCRFDAVEPAQSQALGLAERQHIWHVVVKGVVHYVDRKPSKVGADAEVRTIATEAYVRVRVMQDVEGERTC
jgi:hypothetical protein